MKHRGKAIALSTVTIGLVVLVATAVAGRGYVAEQYYIRELRSPDEAIRLRAAEALGVMRSSRAVPHLIRLLEQEGRESVQWSGSRKVIAYGPEGSTHESWQPNGFQMTRLAFALYRIGKSALPGLQEAELLEKKRILKGGERVLSSDDLLGTLSELISAINSPDQVIRVVSYENAAKGWSRVLMESVNKALLQKRILAR